MSQFNKTRRDERQSYKERLKAEQHEINRTLEMQDRLDGLDRRIDGIDVVVRGMAEEIRKIVAHVDTFDPVFRTMMTRNGGPENEDSGAW